MGWQTIGALDEVLGAGGTPGRDNMGEVVLLRHLLPAPRKLNPRAPPEAIDGAVNELTRDRRTRSQSTATAKVCGVPRLNPGALGAPELKIETGGSGK